MTFRHLCLALFLSGLFLGTPSLQAQVPRLQIQQRAYDVEIISEFGIPVRVGMFGYSKQATFRLDFDGGRTGPDVYRQELVAGDRVVCVWHPNGRMLLVAALTVDADGVLILSPQVYGAAAAEGAARREGPAGIMEGAMPKLKIRPKTP